MAKTKILVTGAEGQLGREFCKFVSEKYYFVGVGKTEADIRNYKEVISVVKKNEPSIIIHTAAMTDVDACEKEQSMAMEINSGGTRNVALAAQKTGAAIIYFSTDYVFDGAKDSAYVEIDKPNPISHYGFTKLMGEKVIMAFHGNWTIIRTGWIYSQFGNNFVKTIVSAAKRRNGLVKVVEDQFGSPTWTKDIVAQTKKIIESGETGLFHAASKGEVSRYQFAKLILNKLMPDSLIEPCTTNDFPRMARRPVRSTLAGERLERCGIDVMRSYEVALNEFLNIHGNELLNEVPN